MATYECNQLQRPDKAMMWKHPRQHAFSHALLPAMPRGLYFCAFQAAHHAKRRVNATSELEAFHPERCKNRARSLPGVIFSSDGVTPGLKPYLSTSHFKYFLQSASCLARCTS